MPRVGFLKQPPVLDYMDAFRDGMREHGYVEGENFLFEYRYVEEIGELPAVAAELAKIPVDVVVCPNAAAVNAAREASRTIPIVMVTIPNPIAGGYVESLARPGGNITGPSQLAPGVTQKRLQILREVDPRIQRVGVLWNPDNENSKGQQFETEEAAQALGLQVISLEVRSLNDFDAAFARAIGDRADALFMPITQVVMVQLPLIAKFAISRKLPSMAFQREFAENGGLMTYGVSIPYLYRRSAYYVDKILKGAKAADLPVEQSNRFDLIVNLKTAQAIGLSIPQSVLVGAAELIE